MATINRFLSDLDERTIAQRVGIPHDEARLNYHLSSNTVRDFSQFRDIITDYYNYHHTRCVSSGGRLSSDYAYGKANEVLENEARKRRGNIVSAFNNAHDGTNGGMRVVLDTICEGLKAEIVERYIKATFDRYVEPNSWDQKLDMIRQFIAYAGPYLSSSIRTNQPESYAHEYSGLIKSYVEGLQQTSSMFRSL